MTPDRERVAAATIKELHDELHPDPSVWCEDIDGQCELEDWMERAYLAGERAGLAQGRDAERADVVAWLLEQFRLVEADPVNDAAKQSALLYWRAITDAIERAAHVSAKETKGE